MNNIPQNDWNDVVEFLLTAPYGPGDFIDETEAMPVLRRTERFDTVGGEILGYLTSEDFTPERLQEKVSAARKQLATDLDFDFDSPLGPINLFEFLARFEAVRYFTNFDPGRYCASDGKINYESYAKNFIAKLLGFYE